MQVERACFSTRLAVFSAAAVIFMLSAAGVARAQVNPRRERPATSPIERDLRYRAWVLGQLRRQRKVPEKELRLAYEELQRDFERIQVINNDFLREAAKPEGEIDYELLARGADEMQKCAARLRSNLSLPEVSAGKSPSAEYDDLLLKTLLSLLSTQVMGFVNNPMFKSTEVIDVKMAEGAGKSLNAIVRFSDKVRKKAKQLRDAKKLASGSS
ncbi:MAG TPA: hypothetical protein VN256_20285 [Pyrinomonadaceae bacterium]|nr:hypothetical protein [Pyrinomonadaceae bacterium]